MLWHIEMSHYNEKARWALDYKSIPHVRKAPLPGFHGVYAMAVTRSTHRRLPVLKIGGRAVPHSARIVAAAESLQPDPPLYPADPADRERALGIEKWFDENLAVEARRFVWHYTIRDPRLAAESLEASGPDRLRARVLRRLVPAMQPILRRDYGIDEESAARARTAVVASMDRLESEIGPSGYMVGDSFTIADLAAAALFTPLILPPERQYPPPDAAPPVLELREELTARPGGEWIFEMFRRHRGRSAEVPG